MAATRQNKMLGPLGLGSWLHLPNCRPPSPSSSSKPTRWKPAYAWNTYNSVTGEVSLEELSTGKHKSTFFRFPEVRGCLEISPISCKGDHPWVGRVFRSPARQGKSSFSTVLSQSWYLHDTSFEAPWACGSSWGGVLAWAPAGEGSGSLSTIGGSD